MNSSFSHTDYFSTYGRAVKPGDVSTDAARFGRPIYCARGSSYLSPPFAHDGRDAQVCHHLYSRPPDIGAEGVLAVGFFGSLSKMCSSGSRTVSRNAAGFYFVQPTVCVVDRTCYRRLRSMAGMHRDATTSIPHRPRRGAAIFDAVWVNSCLFPFFESTRQLFC